MGFRGGTFYEARYEIGWDFEDGHIIMKCGFEWDLSGIWRGGTFL